MSDRKATLLHLFHLSAYKCYHLISIFKPNIVTHHGPKSQPGPPHTVTFDGNYWTILLS